MNRKGKYKFMRQHSTPGNNWFDGLGLKLLKTYNLFYPTEKIKLGSSYKAF